MSSCSGAENPELELLTGGNSAFQKGKVAVRIDGVCQAYKLRPLMESMKFGGALPNQIIETEFKMVVLFFFSFNN